MYLQRYGLRVLPTAVYPDLTEGVTLTCSRAQETVCAIQPIVSKATAIPLSRHVTEIPWDHPAHIFYFVTLYGESRFISSMGRWMTLCKLKARMMYRELPNSISSPHAAQDHVVRFATGGEQFLASLSRVEDAGHLVRFDLSYACCLALSVVPEQVVQTNPKELADKIVEALTRKKTCSAIYDQARL